MGSSRHTHTMFKKAKRANFRRRNESDEDDPEEGRQQQQPAAPTSFGPIVEEIPFMETSGYGGTGAPSGTDSYHSNGFQAVNSVRAVKKEKKGKDIVTVTVPAGPTKASLLSFDDEEGKQRLTAR